MLNILEVKPYDVINGPGIRCSIWLAGCNNKCKDCWSPQTWNPNKGKKFNNIQFTIAHLISNPNIDGISILGGDPFYHLFNYDNNSVSELMKLLSMCHDTGKPVWLWTGYTYEDIKRRAIYYGLWEQIVKCVDVLIDGRFEVSKKDLNLLYRGSSNQRVINLKESEKLQEIIKVVE